MKRKQKFLRAVQILRPDDTFIFNVARQVPEECLPDAPCAAAFELVVALQKLRPLNTHCPTDPDPVDAPRVMQTKPIRLSLSHALRIRSAYYWLKLGETEEALREVAKLPSRARNHLRAVHLSAAVLQVGSQLNAHPEVAQTNHSESLLKVSRNQLPKSESKSLWKLQPQLSCANVKAGGTR